MSCTPAQRFSTSSCMFAHAALKPLALRDGRSLRLEPKVKNRLAIQRFLSRGGGFMSQNADQLLEHMEMSGVMPGHYGRTESVL